MDRASARTLVRNVSAAGGCLAACAKMDDKNILNALVEKNITNGNICFKSTFTQAANDFVKHTAKVLPLKIKLGMTKMETENTPLTKIFLCNVYKSKSPTEAEIDSYRVKAEATVKKILDSTSDRLCIKTENQMVIVGDGLFALAEVMTIIHKPIADALLAAADADEDPQ